MSHPTASRDLHQMVGPLSELYRGTTKSFKQCVILVGLINLKSTAKNGFILRTQSESLHRVV